MFEIMGLLALAMGIVFLVACVAILGFVFKIFFKIVLFPFWLLGFVLKGVLLIVGLLLAIVFAPIAIILLLLALPLLAVAGVFGLGVWAIA